MIVNAPLKLTLSAAPYPAAPVLVMISGLGGTGGYWQPQSPLGSHFQLVSYDQRGTGNNPDTLPDNYTMADMAAELHQALTEAGIYRYGVLGHALGGLMGLQLALDYPESISALVVVNGWLTLTPQTRRCFRLRELLLQAGGPEAWIDAQPLFLYPPAWMAAHEARLEAEACLQASHFQGETNLLRRLTALKNADYQHLAPRIQQPVLAIASRDDLLVPWDATMALQQALPYCQADILDQGGHACNVTADQKFNAIIHPWLIRHMAARPPIDRELS